MSTKIFIAKCKFCKTKKMYIDEKKLWAIERTIEKYKIAPIVSLYCQCQPDKPQTFNLNEILESV